MNVLDALKASLLPLSSPAGFTFTLGSDASISLTKGRWQVSVEGVGGTDYAYLTPGSAYSAQSGATPANGVRIGAGFSQVIDANQGGTSAVVWHYQGSGTINFNRIS